MRGIQFKEADTEEEFAQIHRLNHRIFSEEIGQHAVSPDGQLVDRFHTLNRYFLAKINGELAGMVSVHEGPEFSIAGRLSNSAILRSLRSPLEVRLLAVAPEYRSSAVLAGLLLQVHAYALRLGYSDLLISGIVEREPMYRKMGFRPMGPAVQDGAASFIPMRLSLDEAPPEFTWRAQLHTSHWRRQHSISLLPGPVEIADSVTRAFHRPAISHRDREFVNLYDETRARLSCIMGDLETVILGGSGTLANDVIAANLHACFGTQRGLVLTNGEFGERLVRQAQRAGLIFNTLQFKWGHPWDFAAIEQELAYDPAFVWAVHLETSTGVLNDLPRLLNAAHRCGVPVAADCVSSLGVADPHDAVPGRLFLASGVSGKALGSYAGLSLIFVSPDARRLVHDERLCPTFDLEAAVQTAGPVSTVSTPLVCALAEALLLHYATPADSAARYQHHRELGHWTRQQIRRAGLVPLAAEHDSAPTITTFPLPYASFPRQCKRAGFRIAHESDYLLTRQWGQIATMGYLDRDELTPLFERLRMLPHDYDAVEVSSVV